MTWDEIETRIARGGLSEQEQADHWASLYLTMDQILEFRRVDMAEPVVEVLQPWFDEHPGGQFAFRMPSTEDESLEALTCDQARDQFRRTFAKSKWEKVKGFHVLRYSFASNLASKGVDQRIIDLWMGHQTEEMRLRYRHLLPTMRRSAIELLTA